MKITFSKVIPEPLKDEESTRKSVWNSDFELDSIGFYILNASSGKGKSTFSNIIYGTRQDYSGEILFDDKRIDQFKLDYWTELRKRQLSIVFQTLDLFSDLTIIDNILIKNKLTNHKTLAQVEQMIIDLGLEKIKNNKVGNLSMGQKQRVAIIRALCQPFSWLLLDEPFSHLDTNNIKKALMLITDEVKQNKAGAILTTLGEDYDIPNYSKLFL